MSKNPESKPDPVESIIYQLRIEGHLDSAWTDWFDGMTIARLENGDTLITGPVPDQAALHGLFRKIRDLGMPLVSVNRMDTQQREK
jgi:hypothetical protein